MNFELNNLRTFLGKWRRAVLLFSGGLDSSLLLAMAAPLLGSGLTALNFTGPHVPPGELAAACRLARRWQANILWQDFDPLEVADFRNNTLERCYACKKAILTQAWKIASLKGAEVVWDGVNLDDLKDFRPGLKAGRELGVTSPLAALGWNKAAIREASRRLGLDWQKPPQSCLATRFPYDTTITQEDLARVGQAEAWLQARGFTHVRLRVQGDSTRLELPEAQWPLFLKPEVRRPFLNLLNQLDWRYLELK